MSLCRLAVGSSIAVLAIGAGVASAAGAITAEEVVAKNVEARGGAAALAALHSLRRSGRLVVPGQSVLITLSDLRVRPGRVREEATFQGLTQIRAFDGSKAWQIQPFEGRKDPAMMTDDDARPLRYAADLDSAWVDAKAKGHTLEYLGTEEVDGTVAHKLRVRLKWGDEVTVWIDPDTWMVMRELRRTVARGAEQETETDYSDYERVAGVYVPMSEESGPRNSPSSAKTKSVWEKAEANIPVAADAFAFPEKAAAPAGASR
jgi:outer membrane lipoprotein-sorting protein